jgi:thiosulfate reductase / polysulfide reductase chain A
VSKGTANKTAAKKTTRFTVSRRRFLALTAVTGAVIAAGSVIKNGILSPVKALMNSTGETIAETWVPSSCLNCATRCATRVRVVDGRAVKVMGNPLSQLSDGEVCPRSHIGLQVLYSENRITTPLKRTNADKGRGKDPGWQPISWEQAMDEVSAKLAQVRAANPAGLLLLRGLNSVSDDDLLDRFAESYGTPNNVTEESLNNASEKTGRWFADGNYESIGYDLANSKFVLAFGASILESHKPLAPHLRAWGRIRGENPLKSKVVVVDPRYSLTAAKADRWLPINPGTDAVLALAIANVIISEKLYDRAFVEQWTEGFADYRDAVADYTPDRAAIITGILARDIEQLARDFAATSPAIAWAGTGATRWQEGSYAAYAIFCLNALVGSIDVPGGVIYQSAPGYAAMPGILADTAARNGLNQTRLDLAEGGLVKTPAVSANRVAESIINKKPYAVAAAIGVNANYLMDTPGTARWADAMAALPYYVHIGSFGNEMSEYADIILPSATFLESWAYEHSPAGIGIDEVKIKQPVVQPHHDVHPVGDIVFGLAGALGGAVADSFDDVGGNITQFVRNRTAGLADWDKLLADGVWVGEAYIYRRYDRIFNTPSGKFEFSSGNLMQTYGASNSVLYAGLSAVPRYTEPVFIGDALEYPLKLVSYQPLLDVENGGQDYPWAQQMYLVMAGRGWGNFVDLSHEAARRYNLKDGDDVWVESQSGRLKASARVIAGIHPDVVAIARGQGHYANGQWADGMGVNPNDITGVVYDNLSGQSALYNTRVKVYRA